MTASGLTINCQGHKLYSAAVPWTSEAITTNGFNNIVVKNCVFENFSQGIVVAQGENFTFLNNTFKKFNRSTSSVAYAVVGISLSNARNITITNTTMTDFRVNRNGLVGGGDSYGVLTSYVNNTIVTNLTASDCVGDYSSGGGDPWIDTFCHWFHLDYSTNTTLSFLNLKNATYGVRFDSGSLLNNTLTDSIIADTFIAVSTYYSPISMNRINITGNLPHSSSGTTNGIYITGATALNFNASNIRITNVTGDCVDLFSNNFKGENFSFINCTVNGIYGYGGFLTGLVVNNLTINKTGTGLFLYGVSAPQFSNFFIDNYTTRGIYMEVVQTKGLFSNGSIFQQSTNTDILRMDRMSYTNYFLNVTANFANSSVRTGIQNFTVQEFIRFNVTDKSGNPVTATITVLDNKSITEFSGYYSLSPYTPLNITTWNTSGILVSNYTWSNYQITVNATDYSDNITSWNLTDAKGWTINITLYSTLDECGTLTASKTLKNDVSSTGTCFIIGANDVILDCAGHTITFDTSDGGASKGVVSSGYSNLAIKNCIINDGTDKSQRDNIINIGGTYNNITIINNTMTSSEFPIDAPSAEIGIIGSGSNITFANNSLTWALSDDLYHHNYGIQIGTGIQNVS